MENLTLFLDIPLLYIYVTDHDSGNNSRISCTLNDTRLNLIILTTNAYSLQISTSSIFDYEIEQSVIVLLQCTDDGVPSLSTSILFYIEINDCNDNPPNIVAPLPFNQSLLIPYEIIKIPFIITQFIVQDYDYFQSNFFSYSFTVKPLLDINLTENGTLILRSMPLNLGLFIINVTVYDIGNLTTTISIPIHIYSFNETNLDKNYHMTKNTSLILLLIFFILIFLASIFISLCFLIAGIIRKMNENLRRNSVENSSCESITSSNERTTGSSHKTMIELLDERQVS